MRYATKIVTFGTCFSFAIFVFFVGLVGCSNPTGPSTSTTGTITGQALYKGQTNNSGIVISVESVNSSGQTASIAKALSVKTLASRAIATRALIAQTTTNSAGKYTLTGVAPGTYTLYASSPNSLEQAVYTPLTVIAGNTVSAADLTLTPTGSISGVATLGTNTTGNLGIIVYIAGTSYSALTLDNGSYTITGVPVGTGYLLVASAPGYTSASETVAVTDGTTTAATALSLPTALSLNVTSQYLIVGANPYQLVATVTPSNAKVTWTSSTPAVATVSSTGLVTQLSEGTTTITATSGSTSATCAITSAFMFSPGDLQVSATNSNLTVPVYWRNGVATLLSTSSQPYGWAGGYTIIGTTIYIAGYTFDAAQTSYNPVLWTNGTLSALTISTLGVAANLPNWIQASNDPSGNIYVRGSFKQTSTGNSIPGYWLNGIFTALSMVFPSGSVSPTGSSIPANTAASSGDANSGLVINPTGAGTADIYFCGYLTDPASNLNVPVYWKNGVVNVVSLNSVGASKGGAVQALLLPPSVPNVIVGADGTDANNNNFPVYVIGGTATRISLEGATAGQVFSLGLDSSGNIIAQGYVNNAPPLYWKNWQIVNLPTLPGTNGNPSGPTSSGNDQIWNGTLTGSSGYGTAVYWVDGGQPIPFTLPAGAYYGANTQWMQSITF